ncbi:MAG TPA: BON domain-containing protein [Candidatus Binatia bacterium]|nr:BON domain-containing protein [Candidatus Binatia bacterium]
MRTLLCVLTLLLAGAMFAQRTQPGYPSTSPQQSNPQGQMQQPGQQMPPDQMEQQQQTMTPESQMSAADSTQVQQQIEQGLQSQPDLSNSKIDVKADDTSVTLTGTVANETQHQKALNVAAAHAAGRSIVDHVKIQQ